MSQAPGGGRLLQALRAIALVALALFLFVLSLELLKKGARGLEPWLRVLDVSGIAGGLGFGWLSACIVLSGSPVAAVALALLAGGALATSEAFAMIGGSRLGASFVVLVIGVLDDLRSGRRDGRSAYIGVAALVATAVVYVPALLLGHAALEQGALAGLRLDGRALGSVVDVVFGPLTALAVAYLPRLLLFAAGVACLLGSFRLFDVLLPDLQGRPGPVSRVGAVVFRPWFMFLVGLGVTALTLSVSVSLSLLVPLASKGYLRRENAAPYILGANITTFLDTLLAAALVGHPDAVRVVAVMMGSVTLLSLPLVLVVPHRFERLVDRVAGGVTRRRRSLAAFVLLLFLTPLLLIAL